MVGHERPAYPWPALMVYIIVINFLVVSVSMIPLMLDPTTIQTRKWTRLAWACLALLASVLLVVGPTAVARARVDGFIFGLRCGG
ncbi:hypothetical protein CNECB9_1700007 [Cupriavidus necator]|uniref:Uncharacterized protein n=1 Tax=Cupriavidus necator TaxID=106590 RepID=A0A1K0J5D6_CUPNE|nr:hypothetical protein CNECB9_1700007 [Cupriavidus necator]